MKIAKKRKSSVGVGKSNYWLRKPSLNPGHGQKDEPAKAGNSPASFAKKKSAIRSHSHLASQFNTRSPEQKDLKRKGDKLNISTCLSDSSSSILDHVDSARVNLPAASTTSTQASKKIRLSSPVIVKCGSSRFPVRRRTSVISYADCPVSRLDTRLTVHSTKNAITTFRRPIQLAVREFKWRCIQEPQVCYTSYRSSRFLKDMWTSVKLEFPNVRRKDLEHWIKHNPWITDPWDMEPQWFLDKIRNEDVKPAVNRQLSRKSISTPVVASEIEQTSTSESSAASDCMMPVCESNLLIDIQHDVKAETDMLHLIWKEDNQIPEEATPEIVVGDLNWKELATPDNSNIMDLVANPVANEKTMAGDNAMELDNIPRNHQEDPENSAVKVVNTSAENDNESISAQLNEASIDEDSIEMNYIPAEYHADVMNVAYGMTSDNYIESAQAENNTENMEFNVEDLATISNEGNDVDPQLTVVEENPINSTSEVPNLMGGGNDRDCLKFPEPASTSNDSTDPSNNSIMQSDGIDNGSVSVTQTGTSTSFIPAASNASSGGMPLDYQIHAKCLIEGYIKVCRIAHKSFRPRRRPETENWKLLLGAAIEGHMTRLENEIHRVFRFVQLDNDAVPCKTSESTSQNRSNGSSILMHNYDEGGAEPK